MTWRGTNKQRAAEHTRIDAIVLRALVNGPLTGTELRDEVAARIKRNDVGHAIKRLLDAHRIAILCKRGWLKTYRITDAGRDALKEAA